MLIRTYREGDEEKIYELYKAVYPEQKYDKNHWMEQWRWMYERNTAGKAWIWLAEDDDILVGQYPLIFMNIKLENKALKITQNIDVMTHPDYRHQGIFSKIESRALDEAGSNGVTITIGVPNKAAYPGHIKSGWFDVIRMKVMFKPLNWNNIIRTIIHNVFLSKFCAIIVSLVDNMFYSAQQPRKAENVTITQVSSFNNRIDEFWSTVSNQYKIMVVRDRDYLNWRYCDVTGADYSIYIAEKARKICGYVVLKYINKQQIKVGIVFDILAQSEDILQYLIAETIEHFKKEKADVIYYSMIANKTYFKAAQKNGFIYMPFIKGGRFCAYSTDTNISKEFLRDPENWLVQIGDYMI